MTRTTTFWETTNNKNDWVIIQPFGGIIRGTSYECAWRSAYAIQLERIKGECWIPENEYSKEGVTKLFFVFDSAV